MRKYRCLLLVYLIGLVLAPLASALEPTQPQKPSPEPGVPDSVGLVIVAPVGMPEDAQASFRAALEKGLSAQGVLSPTALAANGTLRVEIPHWVQETPAMGGRSDALTRLEAVVELKVLPMGEVRGTQRFSVRDPRILARPEEALIRLAEDITRTPLAALPPKMPDTPEHAVTKAAKFVAGTAAVVGIVILQILVNNPGLGR